MPLKDRDANRPRRLVRLGIIRLGWKIFKCRGQDCNQVIRDTGEHTIRCPTCATVDKKLRGFRPSYPTEAGHFVLTDAPEIVEVYKDKPTELDVYLPFPDVERNFDANYTVWAGGILICKGDGDLVNYATPYEVKKKKRGSGDGIYIARGKTLVNNGLAQIAFDWGEAHFEPGDHVICPGEEANLYPQCAFCKISGILKIMMANPDLFRFGYYQITTGSGRNYDTINGTLERIYEEAGHLSSIPFKLRLVEESTTYTTDDGKRQPTTKHFLQLEVEPALARALYKRKLVILMEEGVIERPALTAGDDEDAVEGEAVTMGPSVEELDSKLADLEAWLEEMSVNQMIEEAIKGWFIPDRGAGVAILVVAYGDQWEKQAATNKLEAWHKLQTGWHEGELVEEDEPAADTGPIPHPWPAQMWQKNVRGMAAASRLKGVITTESKKGTGKGQMGMLWYLFAEADVDDKERHTITKYLLDKDSLNDLTKAEASVLITLMKDANNAGTLADEAQRIINAALKEAGQQEMF